MTNEESPNISDMARTLGARGGHKTLLNHGLNHLKKASKLGDQALAKKYGPDYRRIIGIMGAKARWDKTK